MKAPTCWCTASRATKPSAHAQPSAAAVRCTGTSQRSRAREQLLSGCADAPPIDILVNNYGTAGAGRWDDTDEAAWLDMYQRNVLSAQRLIQRLLPAMRARRWGRIINLGTVGSTRPAARMPHYYASKGAFATLTISLAKEVAGTGSHGQSRLARSHSHG